jgi:hypothetical protein
MWFPIADFTRFVHSVAQNLTPEIWSWVLLDRRPVGKPLKIFSNFNGTRSFSPQLVPILSKSYSAHTTPSYLPKINLSLSAHLRLVF